MKTLLICLALISQLPAEKSKDEEILLKNQEKYQRELVVVENNYEFLVPTTASLWKVYRKENGQLTEIASFFSNEEEATRCVGWINKHLSSTPSIGEVGLYYTAYWNKERYFKEKEGTYKVSINIQDGPYFYSYWEDKSGYACWKIYRKTVQKTISHIASVNVKEEPVVELWTKWLNSNWLKGSK